MLKASQHSEIEGTREWASSKVSWLSIVYVVSNLLSREPLHKDQNIVESEQKSINP